MSLDSSPNPSVVGVQVRLALAWLAVAWERLWSRLWIVAVGLEVLLIVVLVDVLPSFHWIVHTLLLLAAAAGIGTLIARRLRGFTWPTRDDARVRLEASSAVTHRPLTAVEDSLPPGASAVQKAMWHLHQVRALADLKRLRVTGPAPGIARRDRFAFRAAIVLVLMIAVIGGWHDLGPRLARGLWPLPKSGATMVAVKVWVTPPPYTNRSPIYLETPLPAGAHAPAILDIPANSTVLAVVTGTEREIALQFDDVKQPLEKLATATQRATVTLKPLKRLEVRQGTRMLAGWDVNWIPDAPPQISYAGPPAEAPRWRLRIPYKVSDDYGIPSVKARFTKASNAAAAPIEVPLSTPADAGKAFAYASFHDLTSHPWAGQKAILVLTATDHAGQTATTREVEIVLPERDFTHPVAKELAGLRKNLLSETDDAPARALEGVTRILDHPQSFNGDSLVHLTLSTAKYRLAYSASDETTESVPDLLWHAAIRIEDGNLVGAEQRLAAAEKELRDAIERGAPPEEVAQLLEQLKEAVADYAKAMAEKNPGQKNDPGKKADSTAKDMQSSMEDIKRMSEMGAQDAAKKALAKLQKQLQAMRNGMQNKSAESAEAEKLQEAMRDLTEKQSELMDESFEQARKEEKERAKKYGDDKDKQDADRQNQKQASQKNQKDNQKSDHSGAQQNGKSSSSGQAAAQKQNSLREQLQAVQERLEHLTGKQSETMQQADNAMSAASGSLSAADWEQGASQQSKALAQLQQGMQQLGEQMKSLEEKMSMEGEQPGGQQMDQSDSAPSRGSNGAEHVDVPTGPDTAGAAQRVRTILEEIRKRSSDRTRPESEQEYLRRLQKQF